MEDFNDNAPVWRPESLSAVVSTEAEAGVILTTLVATDTDASDDNNLRYVL